MTMRNVTPMIYIFLLLYSATGFANATVEHYTLNNGLNLYVKVDKRAPVVVSQVWYKVGSSYEPNGLTGISHVLEHMMFQGTPQYPEDDFTKIITANGGQLNAATSYDFTYFYEMLASDKLPISFELEANRMKNLSLLPKNFAKEIRVVREERRMRTDNNPQALTYERFMASAFLENPYHHPVVGWMNDLMHMTVTDAKSWYNKWYAPNNAIVVVVGDVIPQKVYAVAKKYFGPIPSHSLPVLKRGFSVPQIGQRAVTVNAPAKLPWLIMGYNVPSIKTAKEKWQPYALELAANILDGGASSRLPKNLIRGSQIASSASVSYNPFSRLSTLFTLSGTPSAKHTIPELQAALQAQIKKLQTTLVDEDELKIIKTQLLAQKTFAKDSLTYQAQLIGSLEAVGLNWKVGEDFINEVEKITPQQIQAVAKMYLIPNRLTIAYLKPKAINTQVNPPLKPTIGANNAK